MTVSSYAAGEVAATDRLLAFMERCLREGDDDVVNAVAVSFAEGFGAYPGESEALLGEVAIRTPSGTGAVRRNDRSCRG